MDLEVQVVRRRRRVAGIAHEPEHGPRLDLTAVDRERRVRGEVGVVELVAGLVAEPEPVAADVVPPDGEDRPVGDGEQRCPELPEDVDAVVPAGRDVAAGAPNESPNDDGP